MLDDAARHTGDERPAPSEATPIRTGDQRRQRSRGQSMVEFALLLPVLIMILALAADFGRAFTAYITISSAAREGAAYGMQSTIQAIDVAGIEAAADADAPSIWGSETTVTSFVDTDAQGYRRVHVTVDYTFEMIVRVLPQNTIEMERTVTMRVLN